MAERVADGVWRVRGGALRTMNVYLLEDSGGGVTMFDAGCKAMTGAVAEAGRALGGINRVVLGHGHPDHRGAAPGLGVPVLCHAGDRADAEGDGGRRKLAALAPSAAWPGHAEPLTGDVAAQLERAAAA